MTKGPLAIVTAFALCGLAMGAEVTAGGFFSFVPVNGSVYRLRSPDSRERLFVRDDEEPNLFHGIDEADAWSAELDGRQALAMPESGNEGFMAFDGFVRKCLKDGKETTLPLPPAGTNSSDIAALWPDKGGRLKALEAPDIWSDGERLRLWFDNPNKAGVLFVELALASLFLVFLKGVLWRVLGAGGFVASFVGMVLTSSRGAFLSLLCGVALIIAVKLKALFSWKRLVLALAIIGVAMGGILLSPQGERFTKNLFRDDARETSRTAIWSHVPRMIADAPGGWGHGNSARAYIDWYQSADKVCLLKDLISGHLTFLVEAGRMGRFVYLLGWFIIGLLALFQAVRGASPVPAAIVGAFFVSACFNPVTAVFSLWLLPLVACGLVIWRVKREGVGSAVVPVVIAFAGALAVVVAIEITGRRMPAELEIHKVGPVVCFNGKEPSTFVVDDDYAMHGGYWWFEGREVRNAFVGNPNAKPIGYVRSVDDLPDRMEKLILIGEAGRDFLASARRPVVSSVTLVSPPFAWQEIPDDFRSQFDVRLIAGNVASRLADGGEIPPAWVTLVKGSELYIPNWEQFLFL